MTKREVEEIVSACKRAISKAIDLADAAYAAKDPDAGDEWASVAEVLCGRHDHWHAVWKNHQFAV